MEGLQIANHAQEIVIRPQAVVGPQAGAEMTHRLGSLDPAVLVTRYFFTYLKMSRQCHSHPSLDQRTNALCFYIHLNSLLSLYSNAYGFLQLSESNFAKNHSVFFYYCLTVIICYIVT